MTTEQHIKIGKLTALISFFLGTIIFGLYFLTSAFELLFIGYAFIVLVGLINLIVLFSILFKATKDGNNKKKLLKTTGLMILTH